MGSEKEEPVSVETINLSVQVSTRLLERVDMAAAYASIAIGARVSRSEWIREALEAALQSSVPADHKTIGADSERGGE